MKRKYIPPALIAHGNVRSMTQSLGPFSSVNPLSIGGEDLSRIDGSLEFLPPFPSDS